jgi:hypothetical protein
LHVEQVDRRVHPAGHRTGATVDDSVADPAGQFADASSATLAAWRQPGVLGVPRCQVERLMGAVAAAFNARPRKVLGWKTPAEVFDEHLGSLPPAGVASID